jgi:hypothetical protein
LQRFIVRVFGQGLAPQTECVLLATQFPHDLAQVCGYFAVRQAA